MVGCVGTTHILEGSTRLGLRGAGCSGALRSCFPGASASLRQREQCKPDRISRGLLGQEVDPQCRVVSQLRFHEIVVYFALRGF